MNEYGVDELFNGDTVYVQGYNDTLKLPYMKIIIINIFLIN